MVFTRRRRRGGVRAREPRHAAGADRPAGGGGARGGRRSAPGGAARGRALRRRAAARLPRLGAGARAESVAARRADLTARSRGRRGGDRARPAGSARRSSSPSSGPTECSTPATAWSSSRTARSLSTLPATRRSAGSGVTALPGSPRAAELPGGEPNGEPACRLEGVSFGYTAGRPVLEGACLDLASWGGGRAHRSRTARARRRWRSSRPACSSPRRALSHATGRACYLSQDPGPLPRPRAGRGRGRARGRRRPSRAPSGRWPASASPATRPVTRGTCRAASGSASPWPLSSSPILTCWCSTSRRAESTRSGRTSWPASCARRRRPVPRSSSRTTASSPRRSPIVASRTSGEREPALV